MCDPEVEILFPTENTVVFR